MNKALKGEKLVMQSSLILEQIFMRKNTQLEYQVEIRVASEGKG